MDMVVLIGEGGRRMVKRYFLVQFSILKFLGKLHSILCTYVKRNSDSFLMLGIISFKRLIFDSCREMYT